MLQPTEEPISSEAGRPRSTDWSTHARTVLIVLAAVLPFIAVAWVLLAAGLPDYALDGDGALIELRVRNAAEGHQLLGSYSRLGFDHPGPLHFYLCVPVYALSGESTSSLNLTTVTLHLAATVGALWLAARVGGGAVVAAGALVLLAFTHALGAILMTAWDPSMAILPTILCVAAAAAFAAGANGALPVAVLAGSFAVQAHVGLVPPVATALGTAALLRIALRPNRARSLRPTVTLAVTLAIAILSALPPIVEQLAGDPGNVTRIVAALAGEGPRPTWSAAMSIAADQLSSFVARTVGVSGVNAWVALLQAALLVAVAIHAWMRRSSFVAALATIALALHLATLLAVRRVVGDVEPHMLLWAVSTGALSWWAILAHAANLLVADGRARRLGTSLLLGTGIALTASAATQHLLVDALVFVGNPQFAASTPGIDVVADRVADALRDSGSASARLRAVGTHEPGQPPPHFLAGTGLALALEKRGFRIAPDPGHAFAFPDDRSGLVEPTAEVFVFGPNQRALVEELPGVQVVDSGVWGVAIRSR